MNGERVVAEERLLTQLNATIAKTSDFTTKLILVSTANNAHDDADTSASR